MRDEFLWTEVYRPKTIEETILPADLKATFQNFVNQGQVPNMLLCGGPGIGKTTVAKAMLQELDADYLYINGSLNGNIDTLRNEIQNFASSVSLMGGRKYVILDEADGLNPNSTQPALRGFMEEFARNCGFILTCNFKNRIIKPISDSRVSVIDFKIKKSDMAVLAAQFFERVKTILEAENVEYDPQVVAQIIKKYFPDWRRVLNELQRYSATGKIDTGILSNLQDVSIKEVIGFMKEKDFTAVRKWIGINSEADQTTLFRSFYDNAGQYFKTHSIPQLVLALGKYQYQSAFASDPEINLAACMVEIMVECEFV
jgi:DNA polymerase III delta prime subunit